MYWNTFARCALFAALAAAAWTPWVILMIPIVGPWIARALYLMIVAAIYVAGLSPHARGRFVYGVVVAMVGAVLAVTVRTTAELAIGLAAVIGVVRGAFLYRASPARSAAVEVVLLAGGLLFARFLSSASLMPTAFALWGFLLVQSFFFLIPAVTPRPHARIGDPFDEAYRSAMAMLDR